MKNKIIPCAIVILASAVFSLLPAQLFYGVNCGSSQDYTSPQGNLFVADQQYSIENVFGYFGFEMMTQGPDRTINSSEDMDTLYFFRREGEFAYLFDVDPGYYAVNLYMVEKRYHWKDFRVFTIRIEGNTLAENLDIFELVGSHYAVPLRFLVECNDGQINVDFLPDSSDATLSAISVRSIIPDTEAPPQIQGLEAIGGYDMNVLYWDYCVAPDLAGYRIHRRQTGEEWQLITPEIHPLYRYFDTTAYNGEEYEYIVKAEDLWGNESLASDSLTATSFPSASSSLPRYRMDISEENLYQLNINIWSEEYVDVDLTLEGEFFPNSGVRYRGNFTRGFYKKNYKLRLFDGETFNNRIKFNLQSEYVTPSMMPDKLAYDTYDLLNSLNPLTRYIHFQRNDEYIGVYLDVEQVDNNFLERNGLSPAGNLYKCFSDLQVLSSYEEYQLRYEKENNEESDWYDIIDFIL